jgi:hypothetical protein
MKAIRVALANEGWRHTVTVLAVDNEDNGEDDPGHEYRRSSQGKQQR